MERLTTEFEGYSVPKEFIEVDKYDIAAECKDCFEICEEANNNCKECAIQRCFNKLAEYEDAEEKGLLVRLPCPIGTTVYTVISECEGDFYECYKTCFTCCNRNIYIEEMKFDFDFIDCVGEFVFLTREEAEAALKKMQEGK